jgi:hypothetical protein
MASELRTQFNHREYSMSPDESRASILSEPSHDTHTHTHNEERVKSNASSPSKTLKHNTHSTPTLLTMGSVGFIHDTQYRGGGSGPLLDRVTNTY